RPPVVQVFALHQDSYSVDCSQPRSVKNLMHEYKCPLLALSGQTYRAPECPLLGGKRTLQLAGRMSAFDPKRTSARLPSYGSFFFAMIFPRWHAIKSAT